ncbi:MAG: cation-translocating P-type ATPase [Acidimicrobiales bacterium]|nr:cation-translocating P-type ATPase [Acidimicrobiales bacterium]
MAAEQGHGRTGRAGPPEWYRCTAADALARLGTDPATGLGADEAARRLAEHGPNELEERGGRSRGRILLAQLTGVLSFVLYGAVGLSLALGEWLDAAVILLIVVLNALLGYTQEARAEESMSALRRLAVPTVRVRRDGALQERSAVDLVPGDLVLLETGNVVPADGRLVLAESLRVQEAALTGESEAVEKDAGLVFETERALADRRNLVFSGTLVTYGRGELVVTATGMGTELGRIADLLQTVDDELTPLQRRLDRLGRVLALGAIAVVVVVFLAGMARGEDLEENLLTAVSLAVAAIPEAMTAVVTIALSLGAKRMLERRALIRRLLAVETLGSVSLICSDKTGTLTQNRMTVTVVDVADHRIDLLPGPGGPGYGVDLTLAPGAAAELRLHRTLALLLAGGALCNDATLVPRASGGTWRAVGDPTEAALVLAAAEAGLVEGDLDRALPRVAEAPFDSDRKRMTTVHDVPESADALPATLARYWREELIGDGGPEYVAVTKGAVEGLLDVSDRVWAHERAEPLDAAWRGRITAAHDALAARGMRVLGVCVRALDRVPPHPTPAELEQHLTYVGMFGLVDPPRPEVRDAVLTCRSAGIRPVMITGDHPLTARHIAAQVGIADDERFLTGVDLDALDDEGLRSAAEEVSVFARVSPEHKLRLVAAYQADGRVVAMTGDGVNDAPALTKADIGVAMGITGTDVSKGAADMVLLDDDFATIVAAVEEGRVVYDNIRKFIAYLLSCNSSEVAVMLLAPFLGMPLPLLALQILWMNLVTDGLPALALSVEPAGSTVMRRPPTRPSEGVFARGMGAFVVGMGLVLSVLAIGVGYELWRLDDPAWRTALLTTLVFCQLALALEVRTERRSLRQVGLGSNRAMLGAVALSVLLQLGVVYLPPLQHLFDTQALGARDLMVAAGAALVVVAVAEAAKALRRRAGAPSPPSTTTESEVRASSGR